MVNGIKYTLLHCTALMLRALTAALLVFWSTANAYAQSSYPPLSAYVETAGLPGDVIEPGEGETSQGLLDRVRVKEFLYTEITELIDLGGGIFEDRDIGAIATGQLVIDGGLSLKIPGLDSFEIVIADGELAFSATARETHAALPEDDYAFIMRVESVPIALRLKSDLMRPVNAVAEGEFTEFAKNGTGQLIDDGGNPVYPELSATVSIIISINFDGESDIRFEAEGGATPVFRVSNPIMIGESGIVLVVDQATLDLVEDSSPSDLANAWKGIYFEKFAVHFSGALDMPTLENGPGAAPRPAGLTNITATNFSVGTGGFSGRLAGGASGLIVIPLGGMDFELTEVELEFQQNALTAGKIGGIIRAFPFFDEDLKLDLGLDLSGNFSIGIAADDPNKTGDGLVSWDVAGAIELEIQSLAFEYREDVFYTTLNGAVIPQFFDADIQSAPDSDPRIPVNNLTISSEGKVSLDGGWVTLPEKRYLNFNAFRVELSQIGFGAEGEVDTQNWVGFSGGVELVKGLSAGAKFKQLQFLWPKSNGNNGVDVRLQGVEVSYEQKGVVSFQGAADWFEDSTKKGFAGAITANLEFIETSVAARILIGETLPDAAQGVSAGGTCATPAASDPFKFFYLDVDANLATGIPVFANVSIFGLSGLLALNLEPQLCAFAKPLDWFDAHRTSTNVVDGSPPPWVPNNDAFAVGLGVVLGTSSDNGFAINSKVALTVAIPGPVVMLTGQGNVLKPRGELLSATHPVFRAIAVFDGRQPSFLINLGVFLKVPDNGLLVDLSATSEAFFNLQNPADWHLYMGKKTPEEERMQAQLLSIFSASAYYMLEPDGLQFGAKAGYDSRPNWKFGPLKVTLAAWVQTDVDLSWRPIHAWGAAELGGDVQLKAFGFGVGLSANAGLEASSPTPYLIAGEFRVKLNLPWPLPDPSATVSLKWEEQATPEPLDNIVSTLALDASKSLNTVEIEDVRRNTNVAAGHVVDQTTLCSPSESSPETGGCSRPMVEVTYRPTVSFARDTNEVFTQAIDERPNLVGNANGHVDIIQDARFEYNLRALKIWASPKEPGVNATFDADEFLPKVYGSWPALPGSPPPSGFPPAAVPGAVHLKLWSKNPFSVYDASTYLFYDDGTASWPEWFSGVYENYPCPPDDGHSPTPGDKPSKDPIGVTDGFSIWDVLWRFGLDPDSGPSEPAREVQPDRPFVKECDDPNILTEEDLILPPYHVFSMAVESDVNDGGATTHKTYQDTGYFHTEGAPLNLDPFVHNTVPHNVALPHYRGYDMGVRFNETYMDLLYKDYDSDPDDTYRTPGLRTVIEIVDDNDGPLEAGASGAVIVTTEWIHSDGHIQARTDDDWIGLLTDMGLPIDSGILPKDDAVYGRITGDGATGALRPGQRYRARIWLEDPRLINDERLTDPEWLQTNAIRQVDRVAGRALIYEFPLVTSTYESFADLMNTYEGFWWPLDAEAGFDRAAVQNIAQAASLRHSKPANASNGDAMYLGATLARMSLNIDPATLARDALRSHVADVPSYGDDPMLMSDAQVDAVNAAWQVELGDFAALDHAMGLGRSREPLPLQAEINTLIEVGSGNRPGFLLELPEAVDWVRTQVTLTRSLGGVDVDLAVSVVPNRSGARAFIFDMSGNILNDLVDARYNMTLTYEHNIGPRTALLRSQIATDREIVVLDISVPDGNFEDRLP